MIEEWIRWKPLDSILSSIDYIIYSSNYNNGSLSVIIAGSNDKQALQVTFEQSVITYRVFDEWYRMRLTDYLYKQNVKLRDGGWTFYTIQNSLYLKSLKNPQTSWLHYGFYTEDAVMDVIASKEPLVKEIDLE